jgi:Arc/MetJ-type ribon-helix-helix transcriptional regulator
LKKVVDEELDQSVETVRREFGSADDHLRDSLRYVLAGSARQRMAGAIFLGVGIVFAMGGSVVGTLS